MDEDNNGTIEYSIKVEVDGRDSLLSNNYASKRFTKRLSTRKAKEALDKIMKLLEEETSWVV